MDIVTEGAHWRMLQKQLAGKTIGFVHTMGHLHQGHLSLCQRSLQENDITVVAIFVNPAQFNRLDDFHLYPRTLEEDKELLVRQKVDYLFLPTESELYADGYQIQVTETELSQELEGQFRPGHFTGMLTIVLKHLNIIQPTQAYYGEKDYQQLMLIKKMAQALFLPVSIVGCPTVRAKDELALSSRNTRLSADSRRKAACLPVILREAMNPQEATERLVDAGFTVDYVVDRWHRRLAAVWLDNVRLIDNIRLEVAGMCKEA